jgi:hypothetical protein
MVNVQLNSDRGVQIETTARPATGARQGHEQRRRTNSEYKQRNLKHYLFFETEVKDLRQSIN